MSRTATVLTTAAFAAWGLHTSILNQRLRQARVDELTGLHRRGEFTRRGEALLARVPHATVLLFDLDRFKVLNDTYGHEVGDIVLAVTGERLQHALPEAVCGRLGGDEFVAASAHRPDVGELIAALQRPVLHPQGVVTPKVSLGLTLGPHHSLCPALREADASMYAVKSAGGGAVYDPSRHQAGRGRRDVAQHDSTRSSAC